VSATLFSSELWKPALDKYAEASGLSVELFGADGRVVLNSMYSTPLVELFREYGFEPGLFAECARRCVSQTSDRPAVAVTESHGLTVVGTSLVLEGAIVGAAVAGYALTGFSQVPSVQRWAKSAAIPFDRFWRIVRQHAPVPERRLMLNGELLQVLGDALLRENHRTRQYEDAVIKLEAASAAKDEFLAVLSHELRTPLAPILGWASVLKKNDSPEQVHRAADAIERNVKLQSRMVDDLLDVSRIKHGVMKLDLEIVELPPVIRAATEASADDIAKKKLGLEIFDIGEPLFVEGDVGRLQQVFRNILSNAVKFTPAGGSIRVTLSREGNDALVIIADNGGGIASEFLPFVFDIFRQQEKAARRGYQGLGIGLSLVKQLTELHRGTVSVASAGAGRGTEVTVRLPLATEAPQPADAVPARAEPSLSALAGLCVLVVEDSEDARESLRTLLQLLGAQVALACDGREALDMMRHGLKPDLVLCDLLMPHMDGFEFIAELHRRPAHPPVIAVSGLESETSRSRTREAGFDAHMKKPFDEAAIVAAVGEAFSRRDQQPLAHR
jgi:signal transduction histidine kinase/ActR/RegA family two-component response regulator